MNIELNKEFIKEVKKEFRNKRNSTMTYIRIDFENELIMFKFDRYNNSKYRDDCETSITLTDKIKVTKIGHTDARCIHLHSVDLRDVFLDILLSEDVYIEYYKKNSISSYINTETKTECYMSTVIVSNHKKRARYSTMCNRHCDMIVD